MLLYITSSQNTFKGGRYAAKYLFLGLKKDIAAKTS